jgi:hypothetical protein
LLGAQFPRLSSAPSLVPPIARERLSSRKYENVMDVVANFLQRGIKAEPLVLRRPRRLGHHYVLLGLFATLGVLAFILSATSPADDDIQQEFCQSSKSKQCGLASNKALSSPQTFRICSVRSALASPTPQFASYYVTAFLSAPVDEIKARVCSSRSGDRSPPIKSS